MDSSTTKLTWLGHATFVAESPEGDRILIDPWLEGNPSCPDGYDEIESDAILVTHGHADHIGDLYGAQRRCSGPVVGMFEMCEWLGSKQVPDEQLEPMNKGGTVAFDSPALEVTMTDARHSSSYPQEEGAPIYLGEPAGYVVRFSTGESIYFAGDTCLFGDMELIGELYDPDAAVLPIGDRFTMGPRTAAHACRMLGVEYAVPCHWGTFDLFTGTPDQFKAEIEELGLSTGVVDLEPGDTWG